MGTFKWIACVWHGVKHKEGEPMDSGMPIAEKASAIAAGVLVPEKPLKVGDKDGK